MSPDKVPTFNGPKRKASCSKRIKDTGTLFLLRFIRFTVKFSRNKVQAIQ